MFLAAIDSTPEMRQDPLKIAFFPVNEKTKFLVTRKLFDCFIFRSSPKLTDPSVHRDSSRSVLGDKACIAKGNQFVR